MTEGQNLGHGGVMESLTHLALDFPRAFDALALVMRVTPDFDPKVGYGALQGPKLWFELSPDASEGTELLTLAKDDPHLLYLLLKAHSYGLWTRKQFLALDLGDKPFQTALKFVRAKIGRRWGGVTLTRKVKEHGL